MNGGGSDQAAGGKEGKKGVWGDVRKARPVPAFGRVRLV